MDTKDAFNPTALRSLQPRKHLELLDIIDSLRAQGLNDHVDLPQLIVCGDQSSGKSSVLEAISGVPFPKKDNLCTRFATEVSLRRHDGLEHSQITVSIVASSSRSAADRNALSAFRQNLSTIDQLPTIVEEAANVMGIGSVSGAFSSDILKLEVRGPHLPQLTIVDLPGLIHSENKFQSEEDINLVTKLVDDYMVQERSIILAVVSAKNDYANQIVLKKARKVDPHGRRTLGIITKPDALFPGSNGEKSFISLAKNEDIEFTLGWHVVRNLDSNDSAVTDRDSQEAAFFESTRWNTLSEKQRGIDTLRDRLSLILFEQIKKELPGLIAEIANAVQTASEELTRMGRSRVTHFEKQLFVVEVGQKFRDLCHAACEGVYDDPFFDDSESSDPSQRRLRARVQNEHIKFAQKMMNTPSLKTRGVFKKSIHFDRAEVLERAKALVYSHRGKELPGTFNPALIGLLFRELSASWSLMTRDHVEDVWLFARTATLEILKDIVDEHVAQTCMSSVIEPQLRRMQEDLKIRLEDYMKEFRRHPITYNHYLTETVQAVQKERLHACNRQKVRAFFADRTTAVQDEVERLVDSLEEEDSFSDMDDDAAQKVADYAEAYYKVALKRVTDEVPAHVIEPTIMSPLPKLLDSSKILSLAQDTIDLIGGESIERMSHRETLRAKVEVLQNSNLICKLYVERNVGTEVLSPSDMAPTPDMSGESSGEEAHGEDVGSRPRSVSPSARDETPQPVPACETIALEVVSEAVPASPWDSFSVEPGTAYGGKHFTYKPKKKRPS